MIGDSATGAPALAHIEGRRRAMAAQCEELVVRQAALFSEFLALAETQTEVVKDSLAAILWYRDQVAASMRERAAAAQPRGFRRLAVLADEPAQTNGVLAAPVRSGRRERSDAATSVLALGA